MGANSPSYLKLLHRSNPGDRFSAVRYAYLKVSRVEGVEWVGVERISPPRYIYRNSAFVFVFQIIFRYKCQKKNVAFNGGKFRRF